MGKLGEFSLEIANTDEIMNSGHESLLYNTDYSLCPLCRFYCSCKVHDMQNRTQTSFPWRENTLLCKANWLNANNPCQHILQVSRKKEEKTSCLSLRPYFKHFMPIHNKVKVNVWIISFIKVERWDETNWICPFSAKNNPFFFFNSMPAF